MNIKMELKLYSFFCALTIALTFKVSHKRIFCKNSIVSRSPSMHIGVNYDYADTLVFKANFVLAEI